MFTLTPGTTVAGKYRVDRLLGRGGMGFVVGATHTELMDRVAIKFLLPELASSGEIVARFVTEARSARRIGSEHVAKVLDVGTDRELNAPYMVMEFLDGQDLAAMLQTSGPLPIPFAVDLILQACEALAEAHALDIVHRDLKPANLFLTRRADGSPCIKVLDFGICKSTSAPHGAQLTAAGKVMGTVLYASPEQLVSARDVGARSDIWSLGVVLFELLTGRCPFVGQTVGEIVAHVLHFDAPLVRTVRPDVPEALERIVADCLIRDPYARIPNVQTLARRLVAFGGQSARVSAERISGIAVRDSGIAISQPPGVDAHLLSSSPSHIASSTAGVAQRASGSGTMPMPMPPAGRGRRRALVGAALALLVALGVGGAFMLRGGSTPDTEALGHEHERDHATVGTLRTSATSPSTAGSSASAQLTASSSAQAAPPSVVPTVTTTVDAPAAGSPPDRGTASAASTSVGATTSARAPSGHAPTPNPLPRATSDDLFGNRH